MPGENRSPFTLRGQGGNTSSLRRDSQGGGVEMWVPGENFSPHLPRGKNNIKASRGRRAGSDEDGGPLGPASPYA